VVEKAVAKVKVVYPPEVLTTAIFSPLYALSITNTEPAILKVVVELTKGVLELNAIPTSLVEREIVLTPLAESDVPIRGGFPVF
jgi:hypothetical protein